MKKPVAASKERLINTILSVNELPDGRHRVFPIADASLVSTGDYHDCIAEQVLFLAEHLSHAPPEEVARHAFPNTVATHVFEVKLPIPSQDPADASALVVAFDCVAIPQHNKLPTQQDDHPKLTGHWVVVHRLGHTLWVNTDEDMQKTVEREISRLVRSMPPTPSEWLQLLPNSACQLHRTAIRLGVPVTLRSGTKSLRKKLKQQQAKKAALMTVMSVSTAIPNHQEPQTHGREKEVENLSNLLADDKRLGAMLVGDSGVGKSTVAQVWAARNPKRLIFATSAARLVAGMSGLGQWQERVKRVMEAAETLDATIYFHNLADLFGDRGGRVDIANAIRPYIRNHRVRIVGEITQDALERYRVRAESFFAELHPVQVAAASIEQTTKLLEQLYQEENISSEALRAAIEVTDRYIPYQPFPGKAARLVKDTMAAHADTIDRERSVNDNDIYERFARESGIPSFLLRDDKVMHAEEVQMELEKGVVGQSPATKLIAENLCVIKSGLGPGDKPLATYLFAGPTGVGKTQLARTLAQFLFGTESRLVRFDMSEFTDPSASERLIRGTRDQDGALTRKIRQQPFSVILLDEIEKAHPSVFDLLLQVCGEGRLTDAKGKTAYFHNAILVMTSNLGAHHGTRRIGMSVSADGSADYLEAVRKHFRPEFVNRLDRIVPFASLTQEHTRKVARMIVKQIEGRRGIRQLGATLNVSDGAIDLICSETASATYGARALRRAFEDKLVAPCARLLSNCPEAARPGCAIYMDLREPKDHPSLGSRSDHTVTLSDTEPPYVYLVPGPEGKKDSNATLAARVSGKRREVSRIWAFQTSEALLERHRFITTQLARYDKPGKRNSPIAPADVGSVHAELHRLQTAIDQMQSITDRILECEEKLLIKYIRGEDTTPDANPDVDLKQLEKDLLSATRRLLSASMIRNQVTLMVQNLKGDMFGVWLSNMIKTCVRNNWHVECHRYGEVVKGEWAKRIVGPPKHVEAVLDYLSTNEKGHEGAWLVRVRGEGCGWSLGLEDGLHRHELDKTSFMFIRRLAYRFTLTEKDFTKTAMELLEVPAQKELNLMKWSRLCEGGNLRVRKHGPTISVFPEGYWAHLDEVTAQVLMDAEQGWTGITRDELMTEPLNQADADGAVE